MGMTDVLFRKRKWNELLEKLRNKEIPVKEIGSAIVKLGKPFDKEKILAAKDVIAGYLNHEDDWVRREAMWFLTSWGRLPEYQPALIHALRCDPDLDNRSYAATCLGRLRKGSKNLEAIRVLKEALEDGQEDELVRKEAYSSLLEIVKDQPEDFRIHEKQLSDVDWDWVRSLSV
ncbi:MAG TPA: HEAT repeat domain-containing protein [Candidatus Saccharimonadales bacterium]|nr:HEAT repeat domain-containing protein [Candidatus Saccharimonadales bacterium]